MASLGGMGGGPVQEGGGVCMRMADSLGSAAAANTTL